MIIAENVLEAAMAQVFSGRSPGYRMGFTDIVDAWSRTGLRLSDLRDAIREALEHRHLVSCDEGDGLAFELTIAGQQCHLIRRRPGDSPLQWLSERRQSLVPGQVPA